MTRLRRIPRPTKLTIGAGIVSGAVLTALLVPSITGYRRTEIIGGGYAAPSLSHPLGLDDAGVDILTSLAYGARASLLIGVTAALVAIVCGAGVGMLAGYFGGKVDGCLMMLVDYLLVIPGIPLMIVASAVLGGDMLTMVLVIGLISWPPTALVLRSQTRSIRERTFVDRARSLGAGDAWILRRHVLPHLTSLIAASTVLIVAQAVFLESALSFLGLGDPRRISWGSMIQSAFENGAASVGAWWALLAPGMAILLVVVACSLIGQAIEERANPRLRASTRIGARLRTRPAANEEVSA